MPSKSLFPPVSIKEARAIADTIANKNAGQPMRRLDVFEELKRAPDSGPSRTMVTASNSYGLTNGGYQAETLSLMPFGQRLSVEGDESALIDAVLNVEIFKSFFDKYKNGALPSEIASRNYLATEGVPTDRVQACWEMLLENGRHVGLISTVSGSERILPREHAIERKFGKAPPPPKEDLDEEINEDGAGATGMIKKKVLKGMPSLNINLEIHLPADVRPEVYDAIFGSMRKHLIDVE